MKKKKLVIGTIVLLIGAMVFSSVTAQVVYNTMENQKCANSSNSTCEVFGYGICYGISINGDIKQGEGRNEHIFGSINADLSIRNQGPIPKKLLGDIFARIIKYKIKITDLETGETFTEKELPTYIYLSNFTGKGYIDDYHQPWGATRAIFIIKGVSNYYFE